MSSPPPKGLLRLLIESGIALTGSNPARQKVDSMLAVLRDRLRAAHLKLGDASPVDSIIKKMHSNQNPDVELSIETLSQTGLEETISAVSLWIVTQIQEQTTLTNGASEERNLQSREAPPSLGNRDLNCIRILISIFFKWGVDSHLQIILSYWQATSSSATVSSTPSPPLESSIVDVEDPLSINNHITCLRDTVDEISRLVFVASDGSSSSTQEDHIPRIILMRHGTSLLRGYIALGLDSPEMLKRANRLMEMLPTVQNISSLGSILASSPSLRGICGSLLSQQLVMPGGVRGLFGAIFGEQSSDDNAPLSKLEHVARVLSAVPINSTRQDYYALIIPRILAVLSSSPHMHGDIVTTPPPEIHKRAASFTISKMLTLHPKLTSTILGQHLHQPFSPIQARSSPAEDQPSATWALDVIQNLLAHADPSPLLPQHLLSPIIPPLYALFAQLDRTRTADPALKELVRGLVRTWGGTVDSEEAVRGWWAVVQSGDGWPGQNGVRWEVVGDDAKVVLNSVSAPVPGISLFQEAGSDAEVGNPLGILPEPGHLVSVLKSIERKDVNSALLVRALDEYQLLRSSEGEVDPLKTMLHLKLVMEMVEQLGSTALTRPEHVLSFVAHTINPASTETLKQKPPAKTQKTCLGMGDLRIVELDADDNGEVDFLGEQGEDSDDEDGPDDMIATAINLLLAVLEANEGITPLNTPLLSIIHSHLEPLTLHLTDDIRTLAREARLVLTARTASSSSTPLSRPGVPDAQQAQETYQQALKFLQDPILPVRAHGLVLLRDLVVPPTLPVKDGTPRQAPLKSIKETDPALIPAILDIFLQSVQEDDSYIFLNAVKGLVAMGDVLGKDILKGLIDVYAGGLLQGPIPSVMGKPELDKRVRVGEALGQLIKKSGDALGLYVDILVPPFFQMIRTRDLPTALRTSALSLLAQCADTCPSAILPWLADLSAGVIDLVQVEGVTATQSDIDRVASRTSQATTKEGNAEAAKGVTLEEGSDEDGDDEEAEQVEIPAKGVEEAMDKAPTLQDPKLAPFRRSALHFLSSLLRSTIQTSYARAPPAEGSIRLGLEALRFDARGQSGAGGGGLLGLDEYFPREVVRRIKLVLGYVRLHDADGVVRVMAGETLELVDELEKARLGFS